MLIEWRDLEPGDKLKFTSEYIQWTGNYYRNYCIKSDILTVKYIEIHNYIHIIFEENNNYSFCIGHDGSDLNFKIQMFDVVELKC